MRVDLTNTYTKKIVLVRKSSLSSFISLLDSYFFPPPPPTPSQSNMEVLLAFSSSFSAHFSSINFCRYFFQIMCSPWVSFLLSLSTVFVISICKCQLSCQRTKTISVGSINALSGFMKTICYKFILWNLILNGLI